jgi:hypothetical protein
MADTIASAQAYRLKIVPDTDFEHDSPVGGPLPESEAEYAGNQIMALINKDDDPKTGARRPVPYAEYCEYYGNPDRHVVVGVILQRQCPHCGAWSEAGSLWGIDFMDDNPETLEPWDRWVDEATARAWPGYLREVAAELLDEAKG